MSDRPSTDHDVVRRGADDPSRDHVRIYGVEGCGPCEVAKIFLRQQRVPHTFVDVSQDPEQRQALRDRLGEPTAGVVLEDGEHLETMLGVSIPRLHQWLAHYRERHAQA